MKLTIGIESFEEMRERTLARARKLDRGEPIEAERRITFESAEDMLACLTPERIRLCDAAREEPRSITALAARLGRDRKAVSRDVKILHEFGLLRLRRHANPGHGQVQVVEATAQRFELTAAM